MKILVVDDEALARKRIVKLIHNLEDEVILFEASSGKEAINGINKHEPDLVFLDVQMTDMTGFDVLQKMSGQDLPIIVFVTAFDNFAVKAFEFKALDFLLKPYRKERFEEALSRAKYQIQMNDQRNFNVKIDNLLDYLNNSGSNHLGTGHKQYIDKVVMKMNKRYYFVKTEDIKHITSSAYYAEIFTKDNLKHVYRISMTEFALKLDPENFIRVNRSTILNISEIKEVVREGSGDYSIVMFDGNSFSLSKIYKEAFLHKLQIRTS